MNTSWIIGIPHDYDNPEGFTDEVMEKINANKSLNVSGVILIANAMN